MKKIIMFSVFLILSLPTVAQDFASRFEQIVQRMDTERYWPFNLIREMDAESLPDSLMPLLKQYETFPHSVVQRYIYQSYFDYAMISNDVVFKKQMMTNLLNACSDSIELSYACSHSIDLLFQFENNLFDQHVIDTINHRIKNNPRFSISYAYLSGKLYQYQMIPVFEELLQKESHEEAIRRWHTILARLGNEQSVGIIVDFLQKMDIADRLWRSEQIFTYVRQKTVIDILFDDLESGETVLFDYEWLEEDTHVLLAYWALPILTKLIEDFPVQHRKQDGSFYTEEELNIARAWAKEHRDNYEIKEE